MRKLKIYLESTVFNWYFEPDGKHCGEAHMLFEEIKAGKFEAYTSVYVVEELSQTPDASKRNNMLELIPRYGIVILDASAEAAVLADEYARHNIISEAHTLDRLHVGQRA